MIFNEKFKRKYALSDTGVLNVKKGMFWTVIVNLVVMCGMGILYLLMQNYMEILTGSSTFPKMLYFLISVILFILLSVATHLQQYRCTYGLVYGEVKDMRLGLAERLRKLPHGFFGKRDIADLTERLSAEELILLNCDVGEDS